MSEDCGPQPRPYRRPCSAGGGWVMGGPKWQHGNPAHEAIAVYNNVTKVADYRDPESEEYSPGGIEPYPREAGVVLGGVGCVTVPNGSCGGTWEPPCNGWSEADILGCAATIIGTNCFQAAGTTEDRSECRKIGFKNVQARKAWHGRHGFLDGENCPYERPEIECELCQYEPERPSAPQTKYLTVVRDCAWTYDFDVPHPDPDIHNSARIRRGYSVGRYTGLVTLSGCLDYAIYDGEEQTLDWHDDSSFEIGTATAAWYLTFLDFCNGRFQMNTAPVGASAFLEAIQAIYDGDTPPTNYSGTVEVDNTSITVHLELSGGPGSGQLAVWDLSVGLGDEYTSEDLYDDCVGLLNYWRLTDDAVYPWRTDGYTSTAPLVSYDEDAPKNPDVKFGPCELYDDTPCPDPCAIYPAGCGEGDPENPGECLEGGEGTHTAEWQADHMQPWIEQGYENGSALPVPWTGEVRGAPLPAGYQGYFDFEHLTYRYCSGIPYLFAYGAKSGQSNAGDFSDAVVPKSATQWTNNLDAAAQPPGAWVRHEQGTMRMQKWAEILVGRPSYNFFRPCGADRAAIDQTTIDCAGDEAARVGELRFPDAWPICGRIRVADAVADAGTVTVTLAEAAPYLETGDAVDFFNTSGINEVVTESNVTVTVVDETHFTYSGGSAPVGVWVKSHGAPHYAWHDTRSKGQFVVHGWQMNFRDYQERDRAIAQYAACGGEDCEALSEPGDPIRTEQAGNGMPREVTAYACTPGCVCRDPRNPSVVAISPNGEAFKSGITYGFFNPGADDRYGSAWQSEVQQVIPDPLWQAPHLECVVNPTPPPDYMDEPISLVEDGTDEAGWCAADSFGVTKYYAHRPYVEALCSVPSTADLGAAPALPDGIYLGWLSLAEVQSPTPPDGNVAAPSGVVSDLVQETPWGIWLGQEACVCGDGRFADEYAANGVTCLE